MGVGGGGIRRSCAAVNRPSINDKRISFVLGGSGGDGENGERRGDAEV